MDRNEVRPWPSEALERIRELEARNAELVEALKLAKHKIGQHLQGQYNWPPYPALGAALVTVRAALAKAEGPLGGTMAISVEVVRHPAWLCHICNRSNRDEPIVAIHVPWCSGNIRGHLSCIEHEIGKALKLAESR